ncbi:MoaD/ThiS family protein [Methanoplanus limicola]|nr:MoaD/ThiS family protein [Methanoplanus limicola]
MKCGTAGYDSRNIEFIAGLDTLLADGDLIALFPPAAGG